MSTPEPLQPGSLNNGMYIPLERISGGGMGEVYLAHDTSLNRRVVVKLVCITQNTLDSNQAQQGALENFKREVDILSKAHHPHVIEIYYCGQEELGNDILVYMVMPYCKERSLQDWLTLHRANTPLDVRDVATLLSQAGEALNHLHDNGIIHRDIKTTNFLVQDRRSSDTSNLPDILLADFGLAQTIGEDTSQDSLGTFQYKAPEQWLKWGPPAPATDQYQLAVMAYYLLTYEHPFDCDRNLPKNQQKDQLKEQHINVTAQAPSTHRPDISHEVDQVILKALAKYPFQRYPNVQEFVNEFGKACEPELIEQRTNTGSLEPEPTETPSSETRIDLPLPKRTLESIKTGPPKWVRAITLIAAVLVIIVASLCLALQYIPSVPSCSTNPFPGIDSSSYPLPTTQAVLDSSGCEQIGLSVGTRFFDLTPNRALKIQIANEIASGDPQQQQDALSSLQNLTTDDSNDAEALIYYEDQKILAHRYSYVTFVIGTNFSSSLQGETHDALQGAYTAQHQWDMAASQTPGRPWLLLIVANAGDDKTYLNIQNVISQTIKWHQKDPELIGIVGWEDSTRTYQAIQALNNQSMPLISPSASGENLPNLSGNNNFFRVVPPDSDQASLTVNFALKKWPQAKNVAIFMTPGSSPTSTYPADLASYWAQDLGDRQVTARSYDYTFNDLQTIQISLNNALRTKPDLIFFSGYAGDLETLLENQSHNPDSELRNIPVIAGDAAATMSDYTHLPPGLDHAYFTSFASEETNPGADFFRIYRQTFYNFTSLTHVNDVDEDTILEYDAIEALLHGYQYQENASGKITLSQALRTMGTYQGVSGRITFDSSGNPIQKFIVLEHVSINKNRLEVLDHSGNY